MSWEIIYDKQFVKVNDKYVAIVLTGSNNCYDVGGYGTRDRRERNWYNISHVNTNGKKLATAKELLDGCDEYRESLVKRHQERDDPYSDNRFGYFSSLCIGSTTHSTTFGQYKGIFATGIKKALTVEQLAEVNEYVMVFTYDYNREETEAKCKELGIKFLESVTAKTTEGLLRSIGEFEKNYKDSGINWSIGFNTGGRSMENNMKYIRRKFFPRQKLESEYVETKEYYTIMAENGYYFHRFTKWGYRYSYGSDKHRFLTEKAANRFIKTKNGRGGLKTKLMKLDYAVRVKAK